MEELKPIQVPKYEELSVKQLYIQCMEDKVLSQYLPEQGDKGKQLDRTFFFNVINTVYPEFIQKLIEHANNLRNNPQSNEFKKDYILISSEWYQKLMQHPYISSKHSFTKINILGKPGKTVHLLKANSKILKGRRQRQHVELGTSLKRFKGMGENSRSLISNDKENEGQEEGEIEITEANYDYQKTGMNSTYRPTFTI